MGSSSVPVIDLSPWYGEEPAARAAVAEQLDEALSTVGFFLVTGHDVPRELRDRVRSAGQRFFALPDEAKRRYAATVAGRGWLPPGVEANAHAEGTETPPDLKESYTVGADQPVGIPDVDAYWFRSNVWPDEVPELQQLLTHYIGHMRLLELCAAALQQPTDYFTRVSDHPTHTLNVNWYPPLSLVGEPAGNQYRIGPHTDFGTVTILDRERGSGGLQVWNPDGEWEDAPWVDDAFTINTGDLLARWSGDRWMSNRHRVKVPDPAHAEESLVSLVYFHKTNYDTVVRALRPPIGTEHTHGPVIAADFLRDRLDAITVG
jgi:isopenicillin N synthase-like dioxygenase